MENLEKCNIPNFMDVFEPKILKNFLDYKE